MAEEKAELLTTGAMAKELGVSQGKVKKAIEALGIAPASKKGACNYYARDTMEKVKATLD